MKKKPERKRRKTKSLAVVTPRERTRQMVLLGMTAQNIYLSLISSAPVTEEEVGLWVAEDELRLRLNGRDALAPHKVADLAAHQVNAMLEILPEFSDPHEKFAAHKHVLAAMRDAQRLAGHDMLNVRNEEPAAGSGKIKIEWAYGDQVPKEAYHMPIDPRVIVEDSGNGK